MTGSAFVLRGDTEQEVREFLEKDVYAESGVWNLAKASIIPVSPLAWFWSIDADGLKFKTAVKSPS